MASLRYSRPERISLKSHPDFGEQWLQDRIAEEPAILGLGDLSVVDRERRQERAGRLDLLLADDEGNLRYEVELQLGATDESHIIRSIEYWDIERRRYPGYEHCAVLVAEDITSRFLNVLQLFAGSIPFIAIQLNALRVEDRIVLDFVRVVDQRLLRQEDEVRETSPPADREYWLSRSSKEIVEATEDVLAIINEKAPEPYHLNYTRSKIGLSNGTRSDNVLTFWPRKSHVRVSFKISDAASWVDRLEEAGLAATVTSRGRLRVNVRPAEVRHHEPLLREIVHAALDEHQKA